MPEAELLAPGESEDWLQDPDALRARMHDRKRRDLGDQTSTASDAVGRPVGDGYDIPCGSSSFTRRPPRPDRNLRPGGLFPWMEAILPGDVDDVITVGVRPSAAGRAGPLSRPSARRPAIRRGEFDAARPLVGRSAKS
jgi:hypothetical protein